MAVASVAKTTEAQFGKYYDVFIPGIRAIVVATAPKAGNDLQVSCSKSLERSHCCDFVRNHARNGSLLLPSEDPGEVVLLCGYAPCGFMRSPGSGFVVCVRPATRNAKQYTTHVPIAAPLYYPATVLGFPRFTGDNV